MPIVPEVDVDSACSLGKQHKQIDAKTDWDDERADGSVISHCGSGGPAHVKNFKLKVIDLDHSVKRRTESGGEKSGDNREADEADTDFEARFKSIAEPDADADAENREDHRHHDSRAKSYNVREYLFHLNSCVILIGFLFREQRP